MKVALIHNNQLILGPIKFNHLMIKSELEDLNITDEISFQSYQKLPIHFSDGLTHLLPSEEIIENYDGKYQYVGNLTWEIVELDNIPIKVNFNYPIINKTLEQSKNEVKAKLAPLRRKKENTILKININDTEIEVSTSREERMIISSKIVSSSGPYNYKFNNTWMEITKEQLQHIFNLIDIKIQEAFDWEYSKIQEIDNCSTIDEVYDVLIHQDTISS